MENGHMCVSAESLCCSPSTTLFANRLYCNKNKKLKRRKKKMIEKLKAQSLSNIFRKSNLGMEHRQG